MPNCLSKPMMCHHSNHAWTIFSIQRLLSIFHVPGYFWQSFCQRQEIVHWQTLIRTMQGKLNYHVGAWRVGCVDCAANEPFVISEDMGWRLFQSLDPGDVWRELPQPSLWRTQFLSSATLPAKHPTWNGIAAVSSGLGGCCGSVGRYPCPWGGRQSPRSSEPEQWLWRWPQEKVLAVTFSSNGLRGVICSWTRGSKCLDPKT